MLMGVRTLTMPVRVRLWDEAGSEEARALAHEALCLSSYLSRPVPLTAHVIRPSVRIVPVIPYVVVLAIHVPPFYHS